MKFKYLFLSIGALLMILIGSHWSVSSKPQNWMWQLAPKIANYKPDPNDTKFYYPLPEVVEVTSPFGWRTHPIYGDRRLHSGEDLGAPEGLPVLSAHSGYVRYADWGDGYGNMIIVEYADGKYQTLYAHLSEISVQEGEAVQARQVIGKVGATGGVTGAHLHFELLKKVGDSFEPIDPTAQIKAVEAYVAVKPDEPGQNSSDIAQTQSVLPSSPQPTEEPPIALSDMPTDIQTTASSNESASIYEAPGLQTNFTTSSVPEDSNPVASTNDVVSFDPNLFKP
ncbi:M23 family metallopeptidase [Phormidium sp. CLA17]|uniref:M23 family metallopeptidase n=1 Tax=Leptolyngbya sp. Cla-17 TaxID=2803751 RepID=UPI0014917AD4|nr:M23 family metallopeptidase [Leptolyngbya sp. Cla-17]MBM0743893.1 M23 family metallopeptidase [Leptolyngbya sp. Cla-17]